MHISILKINFKMKLIFTILFVFFATNEMFSQPLSIPGGATISERQLNANNIRTWFKNNGVFNNAPDGYAGFEWPKGGFKFARNYSGIILCAVTNGDTLITICKYSSEFLPGYTDINGLPHGNGDPDFRTYRLVYNVNDSERTEWPNILLGNSDQGAPVYFDSSAMSWKPVDYGNQTMFYSFTDSYPESHTHFQGSTTPLKADIKQINFSFNQPDELKNIIYQEYRIINRSDHQWSNTYINMFSDEILVTPMMINQEWIQITD